MGMNVCACRLLWVCLLLCRVWVSAETNDTDDEAAAWAWALEYNAMAQNARAAQVQASWDYNTNLTAHNQEKMIEAGLKTAAFDKEASKNASAFGHASFTNGTLKRWFGKIVDIGTAAIDDLVKLKRMAKVNADMREIYSTGKVQMGENELALDPGLTNLMAKSRIYDDLLHVWVGWRDASGKKMKDMYEEFVSLSNEAINANGFHDTGAYWRSWYESETFEDEVANLFEQLRPLYKNLHIFVRRKLIEEYGEEKFPKSGHIPAHLLGNMWAQTWNNLLDLVQPYDKPSVDVTEEMKKQGYTAEQMFNVSEEFFISLGLIEMPQEFWDHSMLEKPTDGREVVCHASAWDFYNQKDFRIKQCTKVTMQDLITVHHEMGHVEYFLQYKNQPVNFRGGANPGFHEAVGDVLALSVSTPKHLKKIGLLPNPTDDKESDINFLLSMALTKIAFLPFAYLMDQWRWGVFSGDIPKSKYNTEWWNLRCKLQGISPPVTRSEADFDPGAKFHIPNNTPYIRPLPDSITMTYPDDRFTRMMKSRFVFIGIRYFVSFVIQFQFHKALCQAAGEDITQLHKCDIYQSKDAGKLLGDVLSLGSSKPWPDAMELITGRRTMDAQPLMDYFKPLTEWLIERNKEAGDEVGWEDECPDVSDTKSDSSHLTWSLVVISAGALLSARTFYS